MTGDAVEGVTPQADSPDGTPMDLPVYGIWTGQLDFLPASRACELAVEVEELGYGMLWLPEVAGRDVFTHLALLLSATQRIIGATGIASIWARDAVAMTGGVKALTEAFPERMLLGLGVSHHTIVENVRGHRYERPLSAMRAYLDAMDASPYTSQRPTTPVRRVVGALGPKMLQLSGRRTDGAHPYFTTPEHTAQASATLGPTPLLCPEQAVLLETDPGRARAIARSHTATYVRLPNYAANLVRMGFDESDLAHGGSDRLIDSIVAWGTEEQILARLQAHLDAGATHVCLQALSPGRGVPDEQWRQLAPAMRSLTRSRN